MHRRHRLAFWLIVPLGLVALLAATTAAAAAPAADVFVASATLSGRGEVPPVPDTPPAAWPCTSSAPTARRSSTRWWPGG
jgi:uncharacterized protein YggE